MSKTKKITKPRSKQKIRLAKKRLGKTLKVIQKRSNLFKSSPDIEDDIRLDIEFTPSGLRTFNPNNKRYYGVAPESFAFQKYNWIGFMTLKFYTQAYSSTRDLGRKNRSIFLDRFMDNLRNKCKVSPREFCWVACEEFGFFGRGHLHVIFSFDYLKQKNRMDKIRISDYSENGQFFIEGVESAKFISKELDLDPNSANFHWRTMWDNRGLVDYFCKRENESFDKLFYYSKYWKQFGVLNAA